LTLLIAYIMHRFIEYSKIHDKIFVHHQKFI
jgi:hypothetical protein